MRCILAIVSLVAFAVLISFGVLLLGVYDVSATKPHSRPVVWAAELMLEHSVERRASEEPAPNLDKPGLMGHGYEHYKEMCEVCHAGPGVRRSEISWGLHPEPPNFADEPMEWNEQELFWITQHGLKSAGMPAFGPTHTYDQLWAIVAFVGSLPEMSRQEYLELGQAPDESPDNGHEH